MCNIQYISLLLFVFFIKIKAQQHKKQNCQQNNMNIKSQNSL